MNDSPLVLALDRKDISSCISLIDETRDFMGVYKLGLEFFLRNGAEGVRMITRTFPELRVFLDLKLHDIPNTVAGAASGLAELEIEYLTVHASGGFKMIESAVKALPACKITGVTVLTSLDQGQIHELGIRSEIESLTLALAKLSVSAGARAIVASPKEVKLLRNEIPKEITLITPGIRIEKSNDDQARTLSPSEALREGADLLVIGRPITAASNPREAARQIYESLL